MQLTSTNSFLQAAADHGVLVMPREVNADAETAEQRHAALRSVLGFANARVLIGTTSVPHLDEALAISQWVQL